MANRKNAISHFVNWLGAIGLDGTAINYQVGRYDFFSRRMNRISG